MKAAATTKNKINFKEFGIFIAFFALVIVLMIISPDAFAKPRNLINIIKQASVNGILSCGMMFVIISGGIDLSAGSTIAFAGEYSLVIFCLCILFGIFFSNWFSTY